MNVRQLKARPLGSARCKSIGVVDHGSVIACAIAPDERGIRWLPGWVYVGRWLCVGQLCPLEVLRRVLSGRFVTASGVWRCWVYLVPMQ